MSKLIRMAPSVSLWFCLYLLMHSPSSLAETIGKPAPEMPGAKFGGTFRRILGDNPPTRDPARRTDVYSGLVVRQLFDGLVQSDAHLNPVPGIAEFWEASRDGRTWTFTSYAGG